MWLCFTRSWKLADAPKDTLMTSEEAVRYVPIRIRTCIHSCTYILLDEQTMIMSNQSILILSCAFSSSTRIGSRSNAGMRGQAGGGKRCTSRRGRTWWIARRATGMNGTTATCCHKHTRISPSIIDWFPDRQLSSSHLVAKMARSLSSNTPLHISLSHVDNLYVVDINDDALRGTWY